jgi:hypothetical protein
MVDMIAAAVALILFSGICVCAYCIVNRDTKPCLGKGCERAGVPMRGFTFYVCPACTKDIDVWLYIYCKGNLDKEEPEEQETYALTSILETRRA